MKSDIQIAQGAARRGAERRAGRQGRPSPNSGCGSVLIVGMAALVVLGAVAIVVLMCL